MARCVRCNTEISRSFVFCYPCSKLPKTPITPLGAATPPSKPRPSYKDKAPRDWNYDDRTPGPVVIHEQEPEPTSPSGRAKQHFIRRKLSLRSWKKQNGRRMSVDSKDENL